MVTFREVTRDTVDALIALEVAAHQRHLVTANVVTLAQAAYEPGAHVWGLYDGAAPVGMVALLDPRGHPPFLTYDDDPDAAFLWRLMIAEGHQGKGYGRAAIALVQELARGWGLPRLAASVSDMPDSNIGFYEGLGFRRTGKIIEGEIVISVDL